MATELGQAYVQIMPSAKGISGSIGKIVDPEAKSAGTSAGEKVGSSLVSKLKTVLVAAGIGKIITSAINMGGELEQNLGGTEAVFGQFADSLQKSATEAYKNMGLSASDYMATANKMGSLFQGSGLTQQKSLELTTAAMQRAADVASVMGIDTTMAMDSIAGAAKGNFTMMDNLGVAMNATTLQAYALEQGINFEWNTASQAEKSELAMKMFMDRTSQYAGNFARESAETFSGSLGAMKASFKDLLAVMSTGGDWGNALDALTKSLLAFVNNLIPMLTDVVTDLPLMLSTILRNAGPQLMTAATQMVANITNRLGTLMPDIMERLTEAALGMVTALLDNLPAMVEAALVLITGFAQGLITAIPIILEKLPTIIDSIVTTIITLVPLIIDAGLELFTSLVTALPEIIEQIITVLPTIIDSIITAITTLVPLIIDAGVQLLTALVNNLPLIIEQIIAVIPIILDSLIRVIIGNIPLIINAGIQLLTALVQALPQIITTIVAALPRIIDSICSTVINNIPLIVDAGVSLFVGLIGDLPSIIASLVGAIPQIISSLLSAFNQSIKSFANMGKELMLGLASGIGDSIGAVVKKAKEAAQKVVKSVKGVFGIDSPSKLFAGFGENLNEGLALGIEQNTSPIKKAIDEVGNLTARSFESEIAIKASADMPSGIIAGGTTYIINLANMPASDAEKRKLAQYIEEERRRGLMARGATA